MANIKVWTSAWQWSKETITGLDKIDLIKAAILQEYYPDYDDEYNLGGLEIDHIRISSSDFDSEYYENNTYRFWKEFEANLKNETGKSMATATTLTVRLSTLYKMASHPYLSTAYKAIIKAACAPTPAPSNYCIMLKFD